MHTPQQPRNAGDSPDEGGPDGHARRNVAKAEPSCRAGRPQLFPSHVPACFPGPRRWGLPIGGPSNVATTTVGDHEGRRERRKAMAAALLLPGWGGGGGVWSTWGVMRWGLTPSFLSWMQWEWSREHGVWAGTFASPRWKMPISLHQNMNMHIYENEREGLPFSFRWFFLSSWMQWRRRSARTQLLQTAWSHKVIYSQKDWMHCGTVDPSKSCHYSSISSWWMV